ncbi:hypothetical protein LWI29_018220 [Acer saccharum]|uniref:Uncharacterized protein n=1 Tax=Acer saccharum TaxID=4024 RepID=A0AA39RQQ7_ACESA|nr:hypothetical protein LWI29_018220 [Acer saccharum]
MKEDVGGHKAAVQEDKSIDEEDVGVDAAANEEDVGGKPAGDKAAVQEDASDDAGDKAAGNRAAAEEAAVKKAAIKEEAVEEDAVEKAAVDDVEKVAVQEDEAVEKQDVEEHKAVVEALLAIGSTAIEAILFKIKMAITPSTGTSCTQGQDLQSPLLSPSTNDEINNMNVEFNTLEFDTNVTENGKRKLTSDVWLHFDREKRDGFSIAEFRIDKLFSFQVAVSKLQLKSMSFWLTV